MFDIKITGGAYRPSIRADVSQVRPFEEGGERWGIILPLQASTMGEVSKEGRTAQSIGPTFSH